VEAARYGARLAVTPDEMAQWLVPLVEAGADPALLAAALLEPNSGGGRRAGLNFAGWAKKLTGAPTISVGSVGLSGDFLGAFAGEHSHAVGLEELVRRMEREEFDLIAVGRAILADPHWVSKIRAGDTADLRDFDRSALKTLV
jgi:2,4-dienoyl-CoA reductase-like NADH-dependent reductase (Old Yellow Enzyme family)